MRYNLPHVLLLGVLCLVGVVRAGTMPVPGFSFSYDGQPVSGGVSRTVDARLRVTVEKTEFPEADAVEWKLWFENPSAERSGIVSDVCDGDFLVAMEPDAVRHPCEASKPGDRAVIAMRGCVGEGTWDYTFDDESSATEFAPKTYFLREQTWSDKISVSNRNARSSNVMAPFFNVTYRDAGALVAIGWTGDWKADFENLPGGVRVKTGLKRTRFRLEPGEKLRTSSVLVMNYAKGEDASNKFRSLIRTRFSHVATSGGRDSEGIFATELWGASKTKTMIERLRTFERERVVSDFLWVDAGWYGKGESGGDTMTSDWPSYCGDWQVNPAIHPDGFRDVAAEARRLGMRFLLWFAPENIGAKSEAKRSHPGWVLDPNDGYALWNLGNADARAASFRMIDGFVRDLGLGCYRQDSNQGLAKHFALGDAPDRVGITEIRHITGMYGLWDDLRAAHPGLLVDNCASGGRRIDIETLRRSHPFFRSDYQCNRNCAPEVVQAHNANLAWWLPYHGCTTKQTDLYCLRSAYSSSFGVAACEDDDRALTADDFAAWRKAADEYRKVRRFFSRNFYNHGSRTADLSAWAVWQYLDPATGEGCVLAFRRPESPNDRVAVDLKGVSGALDFIDLDTGRKVRGTSRLEIVLGERRSSAFWTYAPAK